MGMSGIVIDIDKTPFAETRTDHHPIVIGHSLSTRPKSTIFSCIKMVIFGNLSRWMVLLHKGMLEWTNAQ